MLNELLIAERGARHAGLEMAQRHPDVKDARRVPTLHVRLDMEGHVVSVAPLSSDVVAWTLRDAQQNSFPFVQRKHPLWLVSEDDPRRHAALDRKGNSGRTALLELAAEAKLNMEVFAEWPSHGLFDRLRKRRLQLASLEHTGAATVPATIDRFLRACDPREGGASQRLLQEIAAQLTKSLQQTAETDWIIIAATILLDGGAAFLFDALGEWLPIFHPKIVGQVSDALRAGTEGQKDDSTITTICALTGQPAVLEYGKFPQPNLPLLGQTFLFARNKATLANGRYGRSSAALMPVGRDTAIRLAAAIKELTRPERRGKTWCGISSEALKKPDLLLAFVEQAPDAPVADTFAGEENDEDFSKESPPAGTLAVEDSIAVFEKRTKRVVAAVQAKVGADFQKTPVRLAVFRTVDPANRKVVYAGTPTVNDLANAAKAWSNGERNVPPWLTLPVLLAAERKPRAMTPPHVAPFGVIDFSRQLFLRGGAERQEIVGISAAEAIRLFLDAADAPDVQGKRRAVRILRATLTRRGALIRGAAHALRRETGFPKDYDLREALRTITMLGVLLHKLGRTKETYMSDAAFKLGQLLAAADMVHAGYCADVRGGDVPPSLLGNQVFTMAQTAPEKALAMLCRRWKPYEGWARKATREREKAEAFIASKIRIEQQRGWDIRKAVRHAREMQSLADQLAQLLPECTVNDSFRAELLLGYIAGLPKPTADAEQDNDQVQA